NTLEERLNSVSPAASYTDIERSWLYHARENGLLDYGIRPWQMNPYIYCSVAIGHFGAGKPILLDSRCYSLPGSRSIIRLQQQALIPLFDSCRIVVGLSIYPTEINSNDRSP